MHILREFCYGLFNVFYFEFVHLIKHPCHGNNAGCVNCTKENEKDNQKRRRRRRLQRQKWQKGTNSATDWYTLFHPWCETNATTATVLIFILFKRRFKSSPSSPLNVWTFCSASPSECECDAERAYIFVTKYIYAHAHAHAFNLFIRTFICLSVVAFPFHITFPCALSFWFTCTLLRIVYCWWHFHFCAMYLYIYKITLVAFSSTSSCSSSSI